MIERFSDARARFYEAAGAKYKAVAIAHGAALVTLGGIIGNVDDPNFAIRALSIPLMLFAAGLFAAVGGVAHHAFIMALQLTAVVREGALADLKAQAEKPGVEPFAPVDLSGATLLYGNDAANQYRKFLEERINAEKASRTENFEAQRAAIDIIHDSHTEIANAGKQGELWHSVSIGCALGAAVALGFAGFQGIQPVKPAPAAQTKPVSPPTSPTAPAAKSPPPSPPPGTPAPPPRMSAPPGEASPPAADRKDDRG